MQTMRGVSKTATVFAIADRPAPARPGLELEPDEDVNDTYVTLPRPTQLNW